MQTALVSPSSADRNTHSEQQLSLPGIGSVRRDLFEQSKNAHFRPSRLFHTPEDLPWKDALPARALPVILAGLSPVSGDETALTLSETRAAAEELRKRYRDLGREPLFFVCVKKAEAGLVSTLSLHGARVHLLPAAAEACLWQSLKNLVSEPVLLHPVEYPHTRRSTMILLLQRLARQADTPFAPQWQHRHGWPLVLGRKDVAGLAAGSMTLATLCTRAAAAPAGAVDMLSCAQHGAAPGSAPDLTRCPQDMLLPDEALFLLKASGCPERGIAHARAVGHVAAALAWRYHLQGAHLTPESACAAGYLHDIAKGFKHHEKTGAMFLHFLGLDGMAHCIRDHRDLVLPDSSPVTERELVYLADKYCFGPRFVPLQERFGQKMALFANNAGAIAGIQKRLAHARALEARMTRELGISPEDIARHTLP